MHTVEEVIMIGERVYLSDHFSLDMLPHPLPATLSFREISLEEAKEILEGRFEAALSLVNSSNKAHVLSRRLGLFVPATKTTSQHLRSHNSLIVAEVSTPRDKDGKVWKILTPEAIDRLPIKFTRIEIREISPDSL